MLDYKKSIKQAGVSIVKILPMFIGIIFLVGIFETFVTPKMLAYLFNGNYFHDTLSALLSGSITIGQVVLGCIISFALLKKSVTIFAMTLFFLSFTTIGIIQIPLEVEVLGKKFTIIQNLLAILFIILSAFIITFLMGIL